MTIAAAKEGITVHTTKNNMMGTVVVTKGAVSGMTTAVVAVTSRAGMTGTSAADSKHARSALPGWKNISVICSQRPRQWKSR